MTLEQIAETRGHLWYAGFRPIPIISHDAQGASPGKRPIGKDWTGDARMNPPFCVTAPAVAHARNTGILCDGLRAIDIDVDDHDTVLAIREAAETILGEAPTRWRNNSPRVLMLYAASVGEPTKRTLAGEEGKVEVLGRGQQFVAFGTHETGAEIQWVDGTDPTLFRLDELPAVSEDQVTEFLLTCAKILGVPLSDAVGAVTGGGVGDTPASVLGLQTTILAAVAAVAQIPNVGAADWDHWNKTGMALWAATSGSPGGREAWHAWSSQHPSYDPTAANERWDHYFTSPPTRIGAGSLFHMAQEARPGWKPPHLVAETEAGPGYVDQGDLYLDVEGLGEIKQIQWLVRDILEMDTISLLYGGPATGKSFIGIDVACSVATGKPWRGEHVTKQGRVIYIAGEGHNGLHRRFVAWKKHNGIGSIGTDRLYKSAGAMRTLDEASIRAHSDRIAAICHDVSPTLIILDTLARNFGPGDENSTKDMGGFIDALDYWFRQRFGCCILLIHHSGHNMERARGSSSLKAAIDAEYEVRQDDDGTITFTAQKMKDADRPPEKGFYLETIDLGVADDLGQPITSAILMDATNEASKTHDDPGDTLDIVIGKDLKGVDITVGWTLGRLQHEWLTHAQMQETGDMSARMAKQVFDRLENLGLVQPATGSGRGAQPGTITQAGEDAIARRIRR